jgi:hypothetical protein
VELQTATEPVPQTEEIRPRSFFSRLGGVYSSPKAAFTEIGRSPAILVPIVVLIIISLLVGFLVSQRIDTRALATEVIDKIGASGRIPPEQLERMREQAASRSRYGDLITGPIWALLIALLISGLAKLISAVLNTGNRFKALLAATLYATIAVALVERFLYLLIFYLKDPAQLGYSELTSLLASNLGSWLSSIFGDDALPQYAMALAGYVDIFAIAKITLLAIGYSAISAKLKTGTAAAWLVGFYAMYAVIAAAFSLLFKGLI